MMFGSRFANEEFFPIGWAANMLCLGRQAPLHSIWYVTIVAEVQVARMIF